VKALAALFGRRLKEDGIPLRRGEFAAEMEVESLNAGPPLPGSKSPRTLDGIPQVPILEGPRSVGPVRPAA